MLKYLLSVYGLGGAWVWWLATSRGATRVVVGVVLVGVTITLAWVMRRRSRGLHSEFESVPSRAITHVGLGSSRWHRGRRTRHDDASDFEAHVGGSSW